MHLLVLGAFWLRKQPADLKDVRSLNAPSGAGCFLAFLGYSPGPWSGLVLMHLLVLGAFWHPEVGIDPFRGPVLMHLLVLGAF